MIGLIIFGLLIVINRNFSWRTLWQINFTYLTLSFITTVIMCGLFSYRWGLIVNCIQGEKVLSFFEYLFYYTLSFLLGSLTVNEPVSFATRVASLKISSKISVFKATNATLIERLFDVVNLLLVVVPSMLFFFNLISLELALILIGLLTSAFALFILISRAEPAHLFVLANKLIIKIISHLPILRQKIDTFQLLKEADDLVFSRPFTVALIFISLAKFLSRGLLFFLLFKTFNTEISLGVVILSIPVTQIALLVSFTPGGIGIFETSWFIILKRIAMSPDNISTFLVGQRLVMLLFIPLLVAVIYPITLIKGLRLRPKVPPLG